MKYSLQISGWHLKFQKYVPSLVVIKLYWGQYERNEISFKWWRICLVLHITPFLYVTIAQKNFAIWCTHLIEILSFRFLDLAKPSCTILPLSNTETAVAVNSTRGISEGLLSGSVFDCSNIVFMHRRLWCKNVDGEDVKRGRKKKNEKKNHSKLLLILTF